MKPQRIRVVMTQNNIARLCELYGDLYDVAYYVAKKNPGKFPQLEAMIAESDLFIKEMLNS